MKGRLILLIYFSIPIYVAFRSGSGYLFAFSLSLVGLVLYFVNIYLMHFFLSRRAPHTIMLDTWEQTVGKNIVPRWVSEIGLMAIAFVPSGILIALLIYFGLIASS